MPHILYYRCKISLPHRKTFSNFWFCEKFIDQRRSFAKDVELYPKYPILKVLLRSVVVCIIPMNWSEM